MVVSGGMKTLAVTLLDVSGVARLLKPLYGGRGMILTLHRVLAPGCATLNPGICVTTIQLDAMLELFHAKKWDILPLREIPERLQARSAGRYFVGITLDDGYADNLEQGLPLFRKYEAPFSLYAVTGVLDRTSLPIWGLLDDLPLSKDRIDLIHPTEGRVVYACDSVEKKMSVRSTLRALAYRDLDGMAKALRDYYLSEDLLIGRLVDQLMLSWDQLRVIAKDKLATIGSHTVSHARLAALTAEDAAREMSDSRERLQTELGRPVDEIAYPFGSVPGCCGPRDFEIAREVGYLRGVTTERWNLFPRDHNQLLSLPRVGVSMAHSADNRFVRVSAYGTWNAVCRRLKAS